MFKKLLNVGKVHSAADKLQQQQQQQQKNLFQLNEIRSYGFSHLCCLGYSSSLSLLAVGSKYGLLRVLGNSSVEFSYQLESGNSIRQIEFIDCRIATTTSNQKQSSKQQQQQQQQQQKQKSQSSNDLSASARIIVLTDNGQLHLFELKTCKQQNFSDNTTQTEGVPADCCKQQSQLPSTNDHQSNAQEYTKLERVANLDYFVYRPDDEDRSKRITTLEISSNGQSVFVGTEGGNVYQVPLNKFEPLDNKQQQVQQENKSIINQTTTAIVVDESEKKVENVAKLTSSGNDETTDVNLNDEPQIQEDLSANDVDSDAVVEPYEMIKFDVNIIAQLGDDIKSKKQGAIESIKRHPTLTNKILLSYHRGLNVIYDVQTKQVDKYFYHNQVLESSCFADQNGDFFYTSHNDGSYIKWDTRRGSQAKANEDFLGQLYGPYPCKPTPKIQAFTGLVNDQLEELVFFSGGMPRATYDDKNPVTIVRAESDGKDTIKTVLDFTSKVLDFVVITRPRGNLGAGAKSTSGNEGRQHGKKNKHKNQQKQEQQQQQRNNPIAVALAILAEEEFVVIDLLNSESYLEFALPYLNCVHSSAITCNQHYSDISDELYAQLLAYNKLQLKDKLSSNDWPITGGKVIDAPEVKSHDILLTGHEDGSVDFWDVSDLSMRHLLHLKTARFFSTNDDDLVSIEKQENNNNQQQEPTTINNEDSFNQSESADNSSSWPPLKRVGRFDPYSDDTRLAIRKLSLCPQTGTLVVAGTGGQVLVFELKDEQNELKALCADEITIVNDQRFTWKGREKLQVKAGSHKLEPGYQLASYVQLNPPVAATSLDLRSDWHLYAIGTSYGFLLYEYKQRHSVINKCTLNVQDFAIVSGDAAGAMSRKKSFRKSLRESFRRLRRGRSQRATQQVTGSTTAASTATGASESASGAGAGAPAKPAFGRVMTGVRTLGAPSGGLTTTASTTGTAAGATTTTTGAIDSNMANAMLHHRNLFSTERQVEQKVELSSIVRCITLTSACIINTTSFKPTLWVGTNSGQVLVYVINLASEQKQAEQEQANAAAAAASSGSAAGSGSGAGQEQASNEAQGADSAASAAAANANAKATQRITTSAKLTKEIQLRHRAPIIAIFTTPDAPPPPQPATITLSRANQEASNGLESAKSTPDKKMLAEELPDGPGGRDKSESPERSKPEEALAAGSALAQVEKPASKKDSSSSSNTIQPRVLICSEEQFKVFNLPNLKPFCKFKLTAHEGLRAKKISITQFLKPDSNNKRQQHSSSDALSASKSLQSFATQTSPPASPVPPATNEPAGDGAGAGANGSDNNMKQQQKAESNNNSLSALNNNHQTTNNSTKSNTKELMNAKFGAKTTSGSSLQHSSDNQNKDFNDNVQDNVNMFEPYMVCMSNQGDCAIYSVPDLKRQAQIQVCKREDINGITSTMLTNYGEGYYLKSSSNFLRFSISTQRVLRVLSVV